MTKKELDAHLKECHAVFCVDCSHYQGESDCRAIVKEFKTGWRQLTITWGDATKLNADNRCRLFVPWRTNNA